MTAGTEPDATARLERLRDRLATRETVAPEREPSDGRWPLSFPQQQIWFLEQLAPGSDAYHLPLVARISGAVDLAALRAATHAVLARHAALRTRIVTDGSSVYQRFAPQVELDLPVEELDADPRERVGQLVREPFDLDGGPLVRGVVLRLAADDHVLVLCFHHLVMDGWSIGLVWRQLCQAYQDPAAGDAPTASYVDFTSWQRDRLTGERLARELRYWTERVEGAPPLLPLPTDHPRRPAPTRRAGSVRVELAPEVVTGLRELARGEDASLYMVLHAVFATQLHRYTGEHDVLVGTPVANRARPEFDAVVGMFTNTVVMRSRPRGGLAFRRFLREVRDGVLDDLAHHDLPFELLVKQVRPERDLSYHPVFQVMFALHTDTGDEVSPPGVDVEFLEVTTGSSRYDLDLSLVERGGAVTGRLEYDAELFDPATAERAAGDFQRLAAAVAADPDRTLAAVPMSTAEDRALALRAANGPVGDPGQDLVHDQIAAAARRTPDAVAVDCLDDRITYRELDERARRLANHLLGLGAGPETVVAVCLERSPELVVALLGVLRAGAAYLPVDPEYPAERIGYVLRDAQAPIVVTTAALGAKLPPTGATQVRLDTDAARLAATTDREPETGVAAGNLAYVIHTSGSTGRPKGVLVEHGNVRNLLHALDQVVPDTGDRTLLAVTSASFDISVLELLWTLARGYRVLVRAGDGAADSVTDSVAGRDTVDFSLFYFGAEEGADGYRLLVDGARFADEHGFAAVWTPERHFSVFGGNYPNPAVTGAALASVTSRLDIRAGSVVLPLHDPLRVAEQWAVVDRLSGGRAGVSFASGWHPTDFALAPDAYQDRREIMRERIDEVRRLWRGETLTRRSGAGEPVEVASRPRPVRAEPPVWLTAGGTRATFALAGELGVNLLTHLLGQDLDGLRANIAVYRDARAAAGHDPRTGRVTVMLHTYVGDDLADIRSLLREPFSRYLRTSFGLMSNLAKSLGHPGEVDESDADFLLEQAFERYFEDSGLIGTPDVCARRAQRLFELGVDELACLVDLGITHETAMAGLRRLADVVADTRERIRRAGEAGIPAQLTGHAVSHLQATPSLLRSLLDDPAGRAALTGLDVLLVGGEEFPASLAARLPSRTAVLNLYGPTETTVWSMAHRVDPGAGVVPIGTPLANTQVFVLDGAGEPAPPGVLGEILVGGLGVTRGYHGRPGLTAERFVPNPFGPPGSRLYRTGDRGHRAADGTVRFAGRTDDQVKVRGFRVEPREVEACLLACAGVRDAAVAAEPAGLAAYVVTDPALPWDPDPLRRQVATSLPRHLWPGTVTRVETLPRTANGKLDRAGLAGLRAVTAGRRPPDEPTSDTERVLVDVWRTVFDTERISVGDDFFELGGHSLLALRAITAVRERLGVPVPLRSLFEARTVAALAEVIDRGTFAEPRPAAPHRLHQDAVLAPDLRPAATGPWAPPARVLVTGATGFLGRVLVAELLAREDVTVHCLVLAPDDDAALREVEETLRAARLWRERWRSRLVAVAGNLARPGLGLDQRRFTELAATIDTVYHAGALVHLLYPYDVLKGPNVDGTVEALRFACAGRPKTFHHVSTLDVFPDDVPHREDTPPAADCRVRGAYPQSKWVAERLVRQAADRGLPVCVLRPGNVAGDTRTGYWTQHDPLYTLLRGCPEVGAAPDLDLTVNLTPVDYVAAAIVALSFGEPSVGRSFHLFNPHRGARWSEVVDAMRGAGYDLDLVSYAAWRARDAGESAGLVALSAEFDGLVDIAAGGSGRGAIEIDCSATVAALAGTGVECPPVDAALIGTYLGHWRERGLVPEPREPEQITGGQHA